MPPEGRIFLKDGFQKVQLKKHANSTLGNAKTALVTWIVSGLTPINFLLEDKCKRGHGKVCPVGKWQVFFAQEIKAGWERVGWLAQLRHIVENGRRGWGLGGRGL